MSERRINEKISHSFVTLISNTGEKLGVVAKEKAIMEAKKIGLDLVQVTDDKINPVCKIIDYGKMKYDESKKKKSNSSQSVTKEMIARCNIADHDIAVKNAKIDEFLGKNYKVIYNFIIERDHFRTPIQQVSDKFNKILTYFDGRANYNKPTLSTSDKRKVFSTVLTPKV